MIMIGLGWIEIEIEIVTLWERKRQKQHKERERGQELPGRETSSILIEFLDLRDFFSSPGPGVSRSSDFDCYSFKRMCYKTTIQSQFFFFMNER